jgi:flagellin-specific chaperone FliS
MDELTERQKIILLLEGAVADLERAADLIADGASGNAVGYINSVINRLERNSKELEIIDANEKADTQERANMEAIFVR